MSVLPLSVHSSLFPHHSCIHNLYTTPFRSKAPPSGATDELSSGGNAGTEDALTATANTNNPSTVVHFFSEEKDMLGKRKKNMLVFVVGGISYLEIAALRFLSNDPAYPYHIIIGTTSIGNSLLKSLVHSGL